MITKIVERLKTGTVTNVVAFGSNLPQAPYVVVKQESDPLGRGTAFRVIAHFLPGQQTFLEDYIRNDLGNLLTDFSSLSRHGNLNSLYEDEFLDLPQITANNDDGTISMERIFYMPDKW